MGVATYKTADEMDPELLKVLPPKEELQRGFDVVTGKKIVTSSVTSSTNRKTTEYNKID